MSTKIWRRQKNEERLKRRRKVADVVTYKDINDALREYKKPRTPEEHLKRFLERQQYA